MKKKFLAATLAALALSVSALAAGPEPVHAACWDNTLMVEDAYAGSYDAQGGLRHLLSYGGTVYLPLATAADWLGAAAQWDAAANSVTLTTGKAQAAVITAAQASDRTQGQDRTAYMQEAAQGADGQLCRDMTVVVDGQTLEMKNALGQRVYPLVWRDCVYLPVRTVGQLLGKDVLYWAETSAEGREERIYLYDGLTEAQSAEVRAYFDAAQAQADEYGAVLAQMQADRAVMTETAFKAYADRLQAAAKTIADAPVSAVPLARYHEKAVQGDAEELWRDTAQYFHPEWWQGSERPTEWTEQLARILADGADPSGSYQQLTRQIAARRAILEAAANS